MAEKGMLVDTSKCTACRGCQVACKQWNELSAETTSFFASDAGYQNPPDLSAATYCLVKFHSAGNGSGDPEWLFRKHQCMHCTNAACVEVCPVDAMQKNADTGFVFVDEEVCIGCGACVAACPFEVPHLTSADPKKAKKCWACLDRVTNGEETACAKTCPSGAISFGDRSAMVTQAQARKAELELKGKTAYLYGVDELGGLHQIYVLLMDPSLYGLPTADELDLSSRRAYLLYLSEQAKQYLKKAVSF